MPSRRLLAALAVAAAVTATATAPAASAAPVCRVVKVGDGSLVSLTVCVTAEVTGSGLSRSATVHVTCSVPPFMAEPEACDGTGVDVGRTGTDPGWYTQAPEVDPATGSVRVYGTSGWVYVNGTPRLVTIPGFCVGDPAFCA
ncbi:MAG TPA: hypothetical protein VNA20_08770 [Frankiaceae bacterium]|nr:hypothetical protein [Frankiaceae bacterium]